MPHWFVAGPVQERIQGTGLTAHHQSVALTHGAVRIHVDEIAILLPCGEVAKDHRLHLGRGLRDASTRQRRAGGNQEFGNLALAVLDPFDPECAQGLAGQRSQRQHRRRHGGCAQGEDVMDRFAQAIDEILIEHSDDDTHVGMDAAHRQGGRDVDQVLAGKNENAARVGHARLLQGFAVPNITLDQAHIFQARVIRRAVDIDRNDRQSRRPQVFQDTPADAAQATEDERLFHNELL